MHHVRCRHPPDLRGSDMAKPTIVLVHEAWAEGASRNAVSTELQGQGFTVLTPPNLLHGVAGDAAYVLLAGDFAAHLTRLPYAAGHPGCPQKNDVCSKVIVHAVRLSSSLARDATAPASVSASIAPFPGAWIEVRTGQSAVLLDVPERGVAPEAQEATHALPTAPGDRARRYRAAGVVVVDGDTRTVLEGLATHPAGVTLDLQLPVELGLGDAEPGKFVCLAPARLDLGRDHAGGPGRRSSLSLAFHRLR
jgi:hypothetical protein